MRWVPQAQKMIVDIIALQNGKCCPIATLHYLPLQAGTSGVLHQATRQLKSYVVENPVASTIGRLFWMAYRVALFSWTQASEPGNLAGLYFALINIVLNIEFSVPEVFGRTLR
jgi:hypothetical protein